MQSCFQDLSYINVATASMNYCCCQVLLDNTWNKTHAHQPLVLMKTLVQSEKHP